MTIMHPRAPLSSLVPLVATLLLACPVAARPQDAPAAIQYSVDLRDAPRHLVTVTAEIPVQGAETELMMAVWTPGSYLVREYAQHVVDIRAEDRSGRPLKLVKTTKNRWRVETPGRSRTFRVIYQVYCRERSVRTNWVADRYAVLNGAPTFITCPDLIESPHIVSLELPGDWRRSATALLPDGSRPHQYRAGSFHELVDSPIVAGALEVYPFEVAGVPHALVNVNDAGFWDGNRSVRDLARIVEAHHNLWRRVPYRRYLFINVIGETGGGGLEHDNCCLLEASQWTCNDPARYLGWLSLCSHEFFHAWNVRRLRPRELARYDYEKENYTPSLWVAEGITTYYEDLLLVRAGLADESRQLGVLSGMVTSLQQTPGRLKQSLRDSSHDAWIKYYRTSEYSRNAEISYYTKGAVAAWLLDAEIRSATDGRRSLDDVLRLLWRRNSRGEGYTAESFREACSSIAGKDLAEWFARTIDSTDELDYQTAADWFGLDIGPFRAGQERSSSAAGEEGETSPDAGDASPRRRRTSSTRSVAGSAWTGITTRDDAGRILVSGVAVDSPAAEAGLSLDDELLAVEGLRLRGSLDTRLQSYRIGDTVRLLIARDQRIIEVPIRLARREVVSWIISPASSGGETASRRRTHWMAGTVPETDAEAPDSKQAGPPEDKRPDDPAADGRVPTVSLQAADRAAD